SKLTHDLTEGIAYDPAMTLEIGPFSISFLTTQHSIPCYRMRLSAGKTTMIYTADTSNKKEEVKLSKHADLLIRDCNFYAEQDGSKAGHMTSKEGGSIAKDANVKHLLLSHLPQYGELSQLKKEAGEEFNGKIDLAHSGWKWKL